jgi:hypothetical protein
LDSFFRQLDTINIRMQPLVFEVKRTDISVMSQTTDDYLEKLPVILDFEDVADASLYLPLPDGWALAVADIIDSTGAIESGRYKAVNMAGAGVISAIANVLGKADLPFVFGGDGAVVAIPPDGLDQARGALSRAQSWVRDDMDLGLRAALVPVSEIRANGLDVRVARYRASEHATYAMFSGGGNSWAEARMKEGLYTIEAAASGSRPDLTGLSCRWNPIKSNHGQIVSIIAIPHPKADPTAFRKLVARVVMLANEDGRGGHPVPVDGPELGFVREGLGMEARAQSAQGDLTARLRHSLSILGQVFLVRVLYAFGASLGRFNAANYKREVASNTDFRKFDDGLKMTVDVSVSSLARIKDTLKQAADDGVCYYGMHEQDAALMTCIVPTALSHDHMHFVDGASGGYATAASRLKAQMA